MSDRFSSPWVARASIGCAVALCVAAAVRAQVGASDKTERGRSLALRVCAACHVVSKEQKFEPILKPAAPSFAALARRPDLSERFLRAFLAAPHANMGRNEAMPNPLLADYQIDAIVAYLTSLKNER